MTKTAVVLAVLLLAAMVPVPASAAECVKKITSYWGYDVGGGEVLCQWDLGPYIPPSVVGQKIRECDGYTWTWGHTTCTYYTPTIDYEDCPPCNLAQAETPQADTAQCPVAETGE
jgi:hypothetical protein